MADISDSELFDSAISESGSPEPVAEVVTQQEPVQPQPAGQQRDEQGRFAAKADEQGVEQQPVQTETHAENGKAVPVGAVQAERGKRQAAEAEAETLRRELAELRGQVTLLTQQRQPAAQPQEVKQPATIWDDPDNFIQSQLSPVQQQMQEMREMMWENQAAQAHTVEKLEAAKAAAQALAGTPAGQHLHSEIMAGGNPYSNLVKWHERQQTLATVGNDPQAWLQAELEKRMADPAFQAQVIERARGGVVQNGNRSQQPVTSIPPSLSRIPSGGNQAIDNDVSDAALFSHATR